MYLNLDHVSQRIAAVSPGTKVVLVLDVVFVEVLTGTFTDEATQTTVALTARMRAIVTNSVPGATVTLNITPLTELAVVQAHAGWLSRPPMDS